ncbi:MAG: flagellar basal body rod C-terminal domain-containing protein [Holophaga sp.]|jgi:flagellar basal-body rod protein FlgC
MDPMSVSLTGLQTAAQSVALSANNVANLNSAGYRAGSLVQEELPQGGVAAVAVQRSQEPTAPGGSNVDLATEAVNLDLAGTGYQANLAVIKTQEKVLGTALDLKA